MKIQELANNKINFLSKVFNKLNDGSLIKGKDTKTFTMMCLYAQEDGKLKVDKNLRNEFEGLLNLTTQSMTNSIARLKDSGLIEGERGIYILKPELLWKGTKKSRIEFFQENNIFEIEIKIR